MLWWDVLECTIVCKSKLDAIMEEDIPTGASASYRANVSDDGRGNGVQSRVFCCLGTHRAKEEEEKTNVALCWCWCAKDSAIWMHLRVEQSIWQFGVFCMCRLPWLFV